MFTPTRILVVLSLLAATVQAQAACETKKFNGQSLSRCKAWPAYKDQAISAKSTFVPDSIGGHDGVFDLDLSLINTASAKLLASYAKPGAYNSDAVSFDDLKIDTARYNLAPGVRAFGLRSKYASHGSRANPYAKTDLALYVRKDQKLQPVLEGLVIDKDFGEGMGDCDTQDTRIRRSLETGSLSHNGFADLIVTTSGSVMKSVTSGKECVSSTTDLKKTQITLKYDGKQYVVPEDFRGY